jgi:hypothetical protein
MNRTRIFAALLVFACSVIASGSASALDFGLSASGQSFGSTDYERAGILPGLYVKGSAIVGLFSRLEFEPCLIMELAPDPFRGCFVGADATFAILGSRFDGYFNMFLSLGYLRGLDLSKNISEGNNYLSLRLTPLAIGCRYYGRRERIFTVGVLYEIGDNSITVSFNILSFDFFV